MASVPVDDEQPRCALSGEKFEKFWHDDFQVFHQNFANPCCAEISLNLKIAGAFRLCCFHWQLSEYDFGH